MTSHIRSLVPTAVLVALLGCSNDPAPSAPRITPPLTAEGVIDPEPTPAGPTLDELFLEIGKEVPGFAGVFVDEDGRIAISLVDTARGAAARHAVGQVFGNAPALAGRSMKVVPVRYSFAQLHSWREGFYGRGVPAGVRMVDADEGRNVVLIGTADEETAGTVRDLLRSLGIPDDGILVEVVPAVEPLTNYLSSPMRPVLGGQNAVTTAASCTLGFKVKKTARYVATNAHCTTTPGQVDGDEIGQPLLQSNYWIGYETDDPAFTSTGCMSGYVCRWADVALFQCDTVSHCMNYTIARTTSEYTGSNWSQSGSFTLTSEPWYVVGELASSSLTLGTPLSKVGQTSGWTGGTITGTCVDWTGAPSTGKALKCQYHVTAVARGGDSGAPVFKYEASTGKAWLAGILWATVSPSFSIFSPIDGVKTDLGSLTVSAPVF